MPTVLDWSPTVDPSDLVARLTGALSAGTAAVWPGDAGYVVLVDPAAATAPDVLAAAADLAAEPPAVLADGPAVAAALGVPVPLAADRLMRRGWPHRYAVDLPAAAPADWPPAVRAALAAAGGLRFRSPDHPAFESVYPALAGPVLVAETRQPTAAAVVDRLGDRAGLAVSAGELPAGDLPTVVRCDAAGWAVARPGPVGADELARLAARIVLFVCTGNTCRSPLAEGIAKKLLADRLGCRPDDLPARGVWVLSAGTGAYGGGPVSPESAAAAAELGADVAAHRSRPVNPALLAAADDVVVMTRGHAQALDARYPGLGPPPRLLCGDADLDDPIGAGLDVYRDCARTIARHLERFIPEWVGT